MNWIRTAAVMGCLAVIAGSFGAHGLEDHFTKLYGDDKPKVVVGVEIPAAMKYLNDFKTGAEYQMYHALALLAVGLLILRKPSGVLNAAGWCFSLGIAFFCGSLYGLSLFKMPVLGMVAPIGGTLMIIGWVLLAAGAVETNQSMTADDSSG